MSPTVFVTAFLASILIADAVQAQTQLRDLRKRGLPFQATTAVDFAVGDVDGDGFDDLVVVNDPIGLFPPKLGRTRLFLGDGSRFVDASSRLPNAYRDAHDAEFADVDGDGDLDLLLALDSGSSRDDVLLLNDGVGNFVNGTAGRLPGDGEGGHAVHAVDVDSDTDLDLVFANPVGTLLLNDGTGVFSPAPASALQPDVLVNNDIESGDLDGDGDIDLVFGLATASVQMFLNDGFGAFSSSIAIPPTQHDTRDIELVDVDGDADLDLVVINASSINLQLLLNDGSADFTEVTAVALPSVGLDGAGLAVGDIDGDGDPDLVATYFSSPIDVAVRVLVNDGGGTFADATTGDLAAYQGCAGPACFVDADADGDLDLVIGNTGLDADRLFVNDGTGSFHDITRDPVLSTARRTLVSELADVDADGDADLVTGDVTALEVVLNDGTGIFDETSTVIQVAAEATGCIALGDVDGDGDLDIGANFGDSTSRLYINLGTSFFDATATATLGLSARDIAFADMDGDGDLDQVLLVPGASVVTIENDGFGNFTANPLSVVALSGSGAQALTIGDLENDGDLDVVCSNAIGRPFFLVNDGTGQLSSATFSSPFVSESHPIALLDVDGDQDLDLVFEDGFVLTLWGNQTTAFVDETATRLGFAFISGIDARAVDFDRDGDLDVLFTGFPHFVYLENDGAGSLSDATAATFADLAPLAISSSVADTDGDGDLDVLSSWFAWSRIHSNLERHLVAPNALRAGRGYRLEAHSRSGTLAAAAPFLALATADFPVPPFGTLRLDPATMFPLPTIVIPPATGFGALTIAVPNDPLVIGLPVYLQALIVDGNGIRLTNVLREEGIR